MTAARIGANEPLKAGYLEGGLAMPRFTINNEYCHEQIHREEHAGGEA